MDGSSGRRTFVFVDWQLSETCIRSQERRGDFGKDLVLAVVEAAAHGMSLAWMPTRALGILDHRFGVADREDMPHP